MTAASLLLASVTIAFPRPGTKLPAVEQCYVIGAVTAGETNVVVEGRQVAVHPNGGWVTMIEVVPGENTIVAGDARVTFSVASPAPKKKGTKAKERKYEKLKYAGDVPIPHPNGKPAAETTIVIDPGHGGPAAGAWSPHGWQEKEVNLKISEALRQELVKRGYRVVMTRTDDRDIPLYDRPKVAHREKADAFISIHHNAPPFDADPRKFRYTAVYAWNPIGERLAKSLDARLGAELAADGLKNNGVPHANFAVTRNPEIPSCLVEVDFITTPEGEESCWNAARHLRVARAIADGVDDWRTGH